MRYKCAIGDFILVQDATTTVITIEQFREYLRKFDDSFEETWPILLKSVETTAEAITGRDFLNKTYKAYLDKFPDMNYCSGLQVQKK